jgi:hypothetical protein
MPSRQSITRRRKEANADLNNALLEVAGLVGVSVEPIAVSGPASRDPELREALSAEQAISTLNAIATALQATDKPDAIAALRQQLHDEFLASIAVDDGDAAESFAVDIVAAYEAYIADERATGPDDQFAFLDAVLGAFGVTVDGGTESDGEPAEEEPGAPAQPEQPAPAPPKRTRKKAAD